MIIRPPDKAGTYQRPPPMRLTGSSPRPLIALVLAAAASHTWAPDADAQSSVRSRSVRLDVTRDTWVSEVGREADGNNGTTPRLKFKSIQEMTLLDTDASPLRGRTIRSATLHLRKAGDERLRRVTVSSVGAEWFEGTGSSYAVQPGGATFRHRRHPDLAWSVGGGDLCHVILGNGGTTWRMADASPPDRDGWQEVPVDPKVIAAQVAGLSHGFIVFDDTGSEWTRQGESFTFRLFPNRFAYSRDQNRSSAPYFEVESGPEDRRPPSAPGGLRVEPTTSMLPAGEAMVSWTTPRDAGPAGTLGFFAELGGRALPRELIPIAGEPGARVEMHLHDLNLAPGSAPMLSVRAVDAAGNISPAATAAIRVSGRLPAALPGASKAASPPPSAVSRNLPRLGPFEVAVLDELDKVHPVTGELIPPQPEGYVAANHLWNADGRRITLQAARNEFVAFQVLLRSDKLADRDPITPELTFDAPPGRAPRVEFGRYQPISSRNGPLPDPIVPLDFPASDPIGTKNRGLHVEIYIPHDLPAGEFRGTLTLSARGGAGQGTLRLPVALRVWDFTLPDQLSFLPEMNSYGLPDNERDYYRLAHRHRTVLNRLPYYQNGRVADGCARAGTIAGWPSTGATGTTASAPCSMARPSRTCPARGCRSRSSTCPCTRTGPPRWRATTTAITGPTGPSPTRTGGRLSRPRRGWPSTSGPGAGPRRCSSACSTTRWTSSDGAGRADHPPGCWTSRPASRTSGPCATSPWPFTRGSTKPRARRP